MPATPNPEILSVRTAVGLTEKKSHLVVAFSALDDIIGNNRARFQWRHVALARQIGVQVHWVNLLGNYLHYRTAARQLSTQKALRPHKDNLALLYQISDDMPLDLIRMTASLRHEAQLSALFSLAMTRKVRVDGDAIHKTEQVLGRACGLSWSEINSTYQRQCAAQKELIGA